MITFPVGFDFSLLIADLMVVGVPIVSVSVSLFVYSVISKCFDNA